MRIRLTTLFSRTRDDRGQGALEYIGILAVVVLVLTLVIAAVNAAAPSITSGFAAYVTKIMGL